MCDAIRNIYRRNDRIEVALSPLVLVLNRVAVMNIAYSYLLLPRGTYTPPYTSTLALPIYRTRVASPHHLSEHATEAQARGER